MNFYHDSKITALSVHRVGNQSEGEMLLLSEAPVPVKDERLQELLKKYFGSPFATPEYFNFKDAASNPVYKAAMTIFENPRQLHEQSKVIAKQHYEKAVNVAIPAGDLLVAFMENVKVDGEVMDAIAIFKVEHKDDFLKVDEGEESYNVFADSGVNIGKAEKGCLIFNTRQDEGLLVSFLEKGRGFGVAPYWKDEFLQLVPATDSFHDTRNFMDLTHAFVRERLAEEYEVDKTDQAHFLNKTMRYMKENDRLDEGTFGTTVFEDPGVLDSFRAYKDHFQKEKAVSIPGDFSISGLAVKKNARVFKSVIKLDKNFHVYIHGNREMIERGVDEKGRKFYRIYYNNES